MGKQDMENKRYDCGFQNPVRGWNYGRIQILEPYLVNAFEKEKAYLLSLDADRLLVGFEETAGFEAKTDRYPGWESTEIQGHTIGHYLSGLSQAYVYTRDEKFACRIAKICGRLKECQRKDGYLFAWKEEIFDRLENREPAWVPWYTFHKILAGLITVYELTGNKDAYIIAGGMGDWACQRVMSWTEKIRREVLAVEYGGMNDALYELYKITKKAKYLRAAERFDEEELFEKLHDGKDILNNLHANTTIPKILGAMNRYLLTGDTYYLDVAKNFWNIVVGHHTYITGGNSEWEHFGEPDVLDGERTACNCETCNVYNMLKLTKLLYVSTGDSAYMDFYERAWTNAILGSQNPETGMTMYFQPMETGMFKVYQEPYADFWCCTGTGMENFTKLYDGLYFQKGDTLYVTRYLSSRLALPEWEMELEMKARFPETDMVRVQISAAGRQERKICFRIPDWTGGKVRLVIDGEEKKQAAEDGYLVCRTGGSHTIELYFYPEIKVHTLPDNDRAVAFTYGPAVLCARMGKERLDTTVTGVQVKIPTKKMPVKDYLILENDTPEGWLEKIQENLVREDDGLSFRLKGTDEDDSLKFVPYYSQYKERYGIYWTLYQRDSAELAERGKAQNRRKRIGDIAVDLIPVGNDQYELAHRIQGEHTEASREYGCNYRQINGKGNFKYEMTVDPEGSSLAVTYGKYDAGDEFDIFIDDDLLAHEKLTEKGREFYTKFYDLTDTMLNGRTKVTVTFRTLSEKSRCRIFQMLYICGIKQKKDEEEVR